MPYSTNCSPKILTLATTPFLFILVGVLCEFAMVPCAYILLSLQEEEVHSTSIRHKFKYNCTLIKNIETFVCHCITLPRLLLNRKKHKQGVLLEGWISYQIFKKRGLTEPQFLEWGCWERGGEFFQGSGCEKNKLNSGILKTKKFIIKNVLLCHRIQTEKF